MDGFQKNRSWIGCAHFEQKIITLSPLIRSQLALKLRTIESQVQNYWFLYKNKRVTLFYHTPLQNVLIELMIIALLYQSVNTTVAWILKGCVNTDIILTN